MTARKEGEEAVAASGTHDGLLDAIVIGGSQAGLAMAWHLARQHLRFVVHSAGYRNPQCLSAGPVLVVGGGNSGFQIAGELAAAGRRVDLSIATRQPVLPQRLAGKDLFWWLTRLGLMRVTTESRLGRRMSSRDFIIAAAAAGSRRRVSGSGGPVLRRSARRHRGYLMTSA